MIMVCMQLAVTVEMIDPDPRRCSIIVPTALLGRDARREGLENDGALVSVNRAGGVMNVVQR